MKDKKRNLKILLIIFIALFTIMVFAYMMYTSYSNGAVKEVYEKSENADNLKVEDGFVLEIPFNTDADSIYGIRLSLDTSDDLQNGRITVTLLSADGETMAVSEKNSLIESDSVFAFDKAVKGTAGKQLILKLDCESETGRVFLGCSDTVLDSGQNAPAFGIVISGRDSYLAVQCIIYIMLIALIIAVAFVILTDKGHRLGIAGLYLVAGLCLGFIYILLIPVMAVPDEAVHLYTAYDVSDKIMGTHGDTLMMRTSDAAVSYAAENLDRNTYNYEYDGIFDGADNTDMTATGIPANGSPRYLYILSGIGITLGRLLNFGTTLTYLLGRLFNMLAFVFAVYYAIKILPFGKGIVFVWALLPITLQQTSSFSYDSPILTLSILVIASSMAAVYGKQETERRRIINWFVFGAASILLIPCKGHALLPLVFIPLILAARYIRKNREKIRAGLKGVKPWIKITAVILLAAVIGVIGIKAVNLLRTAVLPKNINSNYIEWAGQNGYTLGFFLKNPIKLIEIMINTVWFKSDMYLNQLLGGSLGWLELDVPWIFILGFLFLLVYASMRKENEPQPVKTGERIYIILIAAAAAALAMAGMLFYWTPNSLTAIEGVQGRYFLPALVPAAMMLRTKKNTVSENADYNVVMWTVFLHLFVVTAVFKNIL